MSAMSTGCIQYRMDIGALCVALALCEGKELEEVVHPLALVAWSGGRRDGSRHLQHTECAQELRALCVALPPTGCACGEVARQRTHMG